MWFIRSWNFESSGGATDNNQVNRQIHACKSCKSVRSKRTGYSDGIREGFYFDRVVREEMAFKLKFK